MDVREKLFTLFQDCNNPSWKWFPNNEEMLKLIDYLIAHGVTVQKWISVKDRLPENDTRVLVYLSIEKLDARTYTIFDTDRMLDGKWIRWNTYITHWMPLPQPPKGE